MRHRPRGFTVVELVIALVIGAILTSIAMTYYGNARGRFSVRGARHAFTTMVARARADAIEGGRNTWLVADMSGDSVVLLRAGTVLETMHFDHEYHVDLKSTTGSIRLCMTPRGYADPSCSGAVSSIATLQFWQNADSCSIQILPMGQLKW